MRLRRLIGFLAVLGVLLHAGAIVRHHAMMLSVYNVHSELVASLSVICHSDGSVTRLPASELPLVPPPTENQSDCPVCLGMVAMSIEPYPPSLPAARDQRALVVQFFARSESISTRLASVSPPPRGPPTTG